MPCSRTRKLYAIASRGRLLSSYIPQVPHNDFEVVNILIVGSMKYDGQKNIYVQQLTHMDRSRFNFTYASFMGDEDRATFTKLPRILTELGVEPVWRPIPPISGDEASTSHPVLGALVDRLDGKNSDGLNNYCWRRWPYQIMCPKTRHRPSCAVHGYT